MIDRHIYFTGFMASGKSRVGRALAEYLERPFIDTDAVISERAGKSIPEIFAEEGEESFREMERKTINELAEDLNPKVIALGGGALSQESVVKKIHASGLLIRLWAKPEILSERIGRKNTRPLMANLLPEERLQKIKKMLAEREHWYAHADFGVETSDESSEQRVVERIVKILKFYESYALSIETNSGARYPIFIGKEIIPRIGRLLEGLGLSLSHKFLVCTDSTVAKVQHKMLEKIRAQAGNSPVFKFRAGETNKTLASLNQLYSFMLHREYGRKSCLLQFSGGVVGDMAGFGAATYQRGIPFIQIPTTLLSMVDSSVGGKVAVNHPAGKNMIGAFYQPKAVVCDLSVLETLPEDEFRAGLSEIVKYGVIYDEKFFSRIENNVEKILLRDETELSAIIRRSCEIKAEVVGIDEKETGLRAILNYGHTFGHAIEKLTDYKVYSHGIAVSLGMRVAANVAFQLGKLSQEDKNRQNKLLDALGFPLTTCRPLDFTLAWNAMGVDKKAEKGKRIYILPTRIGEVQKFDNIPKEILEESWKIITPEGA